MLENNPFFLKDESQSQKTKDNRYGKEETNDIFFSGTDVSIKAQIRSRAIKDYKPGKGISSGLRKC